MLSASHHTNICFITSRICIAASMKARDGVRRRENIFFLVVRRVALCGQYFNDDILTHLHSPSSTTLHTLIITTIYASDKPILTIYIMLDVAGFGCDIHWLRDSVHRCPHPQYNSCFSGEQECLIRNISVHALLLC